MPARPIRAGPRTACAKPPTCWAACSSRTPPDASTPWRKRPSNWRPQQKQQADRVRELVAQQNAAHAAGQPPSLPLRPGNRQDGERSPTGHRRSVAPHPANAHRGARACADATGGVQQAAQAHSTAWTKAISTPACSAARIGCAAATSPIRPKPASPATCKSSVSRSETRLTPWAAPQHASAGRRDQSRHGRSIPSARSTRRPRRTSRQQSNPQAGQGQRPPASSTNPGNCRATDNRDNSRVNPVSKANRKRVSKDRTDKRASKADNRAADNKAARSEIGSPV